jgi:hypothetical protein
MSARSLRGPLEIKGTFKDPAFRPQAKPLLARTAAAAALYAIAPPAALLALIETGPGEDIDCGTGKKIKTKRDGRANDEKKQNGAPPGNPKS